MNCRTWSARFAADAFRTAAVNDLATRCASETASPSAALDKRHQGLLDKTEWITWKCQVLGKHCSVPNRW